MQNTASTRPASRPPNRGRPRAVRGHPVPGRRGRRRSRSTAPSGSTRSAARRCSSCATRSSGAPTTRRSGVIVFTGAGRARLLRGGRRARAHPHDGREARRPTRPSPGRRRCATTASRSSAGCAATASAAATSSTWCRTSRSPATSGRFGQAGPKIGSAPLWWGCQLMPAWWGEEGPRDPLPHAVSTRPRRRSRWAWCNAVVPSEELDGEVDCWCEQILRRSPQGLRLAKLAMNTATDALYSSVQPRHGADGPQPRLRARAARRASRASSEKRPADWRRFREGQGPEPEPGG